MFQTLKIEFHRKKPPLSQLEQRVRRRSAAAPRQPAAEPQQRGPGASNTRWGVKNIPPNYISHQPQRAGGHMLRQVSQSGAACRDTGSSPAFRPLFTFASGCRKTTSLSPACLSTLPPLPPPPFILRLLAAAACAVCPSPSPSGERSASGLFTCSPRCPTPCPSWHPVRSDLVQMQRSATTRTA